MLTAWYWVHFDFPEMACLIYHAQCLQVILSQRWLRLFRPDIPGVLGMSRKSFSVTVVLEPPDIIAKMCYIFHVVLKKSSQYCIHFLFWNLFTEDNLLLGCFSWGPSPFPDKTSTVKGLGEKKKSFYSRFSMQMSNLELKWKRTFKWTSLPHHPFPLNFSKPSIQLLVLVFWWEKFMWKFMSVWP